jgi:hypothetical protein
MPGILSRIRRRVEELGAPEVPNRLTVAVEDVQHRALIAVVRFSVVVALERVAGRRDQPKPPPPALSGEGEDVFKGGLGDDDQVEMLSCVIGGAVQLVEKRNARRTGTLG